MNEWISLFLNSIFLSFFFFNKIEQTHNICFKLSLYELATQNSRVLVEIVDKFSGVPENEFPGFWNPKPVRDSFISDDLLLIENGWCSEKVNEKEREREREREREKERNRITNKIKSNTHFFFSLFSLFRN